MIKKNSLESWHRGNLPQHKATMNKMKKPTDWEKIFANDVAVRA